MKERETELVLLRRETISETKHLQEQVDTLCTSYEKKREEYQGLFDFKIKLDEELAKYRQLLEAEAAR